MAITNPEAVKFSNEKVRVMADALGVAYFSAKAIIAEWYANDMGSLIPVDGGEVMDGASSDGRHVITGNDATAIINRASEIVADMEAGGNAKLNTVLAVAVNYQSKF